MSVVTRRVLLTATVLAIGWTPDLALAAGGQAAAGQIAAQLPLYAVLPFAGLLLSIAILPLIAPRWWHSNRNRAIVSAAFSLPVLIYMTARFGGPGMELIGQKLIEYASFIVLLAALFIISGGVFIAGALKGSPAVNTTILGLGSLLASFIGTTGAAMLLIRPLLRANHARRHKAHLAVFFIFTAANCGGLLTPLGDPPLFLGFLAGVPFGWTLRLWPEWLLVNGYLLAVFFVWDTIVSRRDPVAPQEQTPAEPAAAIIVHGWHNFLFLAGVVATIYAAGSGIGKGGKPWPFGVQELIVLLLTAASYITTRRAVRTENRFDFEPLIEVAVLFAGIFITMAPVLEILNAHAAQLGVNLPMQFFWSAGVLSSFLDSAPAYLTFASVAAGLHQIPAQGQFLAQFLALPAAAGADRILAAISCGSVFLGALTYIGNGPNFMVKAIAEENGVEMPSFFLYLLLAVVVMGPALIIASLMV